MRGLIPVVRDGYKIHRPKVQRFSSVASTFVSIDGIALLCHATLRWKHTEPLMRQAIEDELKKQVQSMESPDNPIAGWLMTGAVTILGIMFIWMLFLIWVLMRTRGF